MILGSIRRRSAKTCYAAERRNRRRAAPFLEVYKSPNDHLRLVVHPTIDTKSLLAGAQFADAFSITTETTDLTARDAATRMLNHSPPWVDALMRLRDPDRCALRAERRTLRVANVDKVGFFPVLSETPQRLIAG